MRHFQVCRPAICSSWIVRPSAIGSLVLPRRVFPQNSSSSAHTSSKPQTSHQVHELILLSINLDCAAPKEKRDEMFKNTAVNVFKICRLKEARAARRSRNLTAIPFGTNFSEWLNIQKRDCPLLGPSFTNSWPRPFPHFPHRTWRCTFKHCIFSPLDVKTKTVYWVFCSGTHLERSRPFLMFRYAVVMDGLCESWPRGGVLVLAMAGEELMITFGADINTWQRNNGRRTEHFQPETPLNVLVRVFGSTAPYCAVAELLPNNMSYTR